MRQLALLPAGIHRSGHDVLHADRERIYYRSTLAVYVISRKNFAIEHILCASDRSIVSVAFSPHNANLMVMCGADGGMTLWSLSEARVLSRCAFAKDATTRLTWDPVITNQVIVITSSRGLRLHRW